MNKQERLAEITDLIKDAIILRNEFHEAYVAILSKLNADPEIMSSDLNPIGNRVFQILVCADRLAMMVVQQNIPVEFIQGLVDDFEVHEAAFRMVEENRSRIAEARQRAEERKALESSSIEQTATIPADEWPDYLPIH